MNRCLALSGISAPILLMTILTTLADAPGGQGKSFDEIQKTTEGIGATGESQILGVVASNGRLPLFCGETRCSADLSTFCLQQAKENPARGQPYVPVENAQIFLSGEDLAGRRVRLAAAPYVKFAADRGFTAVEVALPREALLSLGLSNPMIEIGERVSLLPVVANESSDPQAAAEDALATSRFREIAAQFFDRKSKSSDAIRLTNQMINALTERYRSKNGKDYGILETALASEAGRASSVDGIIRAREIYMTCANKLDIGHHFNSVQSCLESAHDMLVAQTNAHLWSMLNSDY